MPPPPDRPPEPEQRPTLPGLAALVGSQFAAAQREFLGMFVTSIQDYLGEIEAAAAQSDSQAMAFALHRLKGSTGTVGADEMAALANSMEKAVLTGRIDVARACVPELMAVGAGLIEAVQRELASLPAD